jgi:hypothetical protein
MRLTLEQASAVYQMLREKNIKTEIESELFYELCDAYGFDYL